MEHQHPKTLEEIIEQNDDLRELLAMTARSNKVVEDPRFYERGSLIGYIATDGTLWFGERLAMDYCQLHGLHYQEVFAGEIIRLESKNVQNQEEPKASL